MSSIDVDTVNIREFSIGNFSDVPKIKITFDGLQDDLFTTLLFLLMILWLLIASLHFYELCRNICFTEKKRTRNPPLLNPTEV